MVKAARERRGPRIAALAAALAFLPAAVAAATPATAGAKPANQPRSEYFSIAPATWLAWEEYERIGSADVGAMRVPFFWHTIEPNEGGEFDWRATDHVVAYAAANGIRVQPFILNVPPWLEDPNFYPPVHSAEFRREWKELLASMIRRYGPRGTLWRWLRRQAPRVKPHPVKEWQIWNEPNARSYWRPVRRSPELYARLLRLSEQVIHNRQPRAIVISAGLFETPHDGIKMQRFLRRLYKVPGIRNSFDALALHPYAVNASKVLEQLHFVRRFIDRRGDEHKPLRVTELGWPTKVTTGNGAFTKSEQGQRRELARTYRGFLSQRRQLRLQGATWYTWRDNDLFKTCDLCRFSGLFRRNGSGKPAWRAFVHFAGGASNAPRVSGGNSPPPTPSG